MKVSVICVADRPERLPLLYWSLVVQTHQDWEFIILDQTGTFEDGVSNNIYSHYHYNNSRVKTFPKVTNHGDWGQTEKERATLDLASGELLMFPADDAYYVPTALATMHDLFVTDMADVVLCAWLYDKMSYRVMPPSTKEGYVDIGGMMVRRSKFLQTGFPDKSQVGDHRMLHAMLNNGALLSVTSDVLYVKN